MILYLICCYILIGLFISTFRTETIKDTVYKFNKQYSENYSKGGNLLLYCIMVIMIIIFWPIMVISMILGFFKGLFGL